MRAIIFVVSAIALTVLSDLTIAAEWQRVDMTKVKLKDGTAFPVQDDEVTVNGPLVRRVTLSAKVDDGRPEIASVSVAMKNRSDSKLRPNITIAIYNNYGMRIGAANVRWAYDTISPGEAASKDGDVYPHSLRKVLEYASPPPPRDLDAPAYIVVIDRS